MKTSPVEQTLSQPGCGKIACVTTCLDDLAGAFKALADATRLQILYLLMTRGEMCVCEFMPLLQLTQSNVSFHLKTLKQARFITARKEGKWMYYTLDRHVFARFRTEFGTLFDLDRWPTQAEPAYCDEHGCRLHQHS